MINRSVSSASRVSVVIPVFNQVAFTEKCIEALEKTGSRKFAEIIVVDNASTDETPQFLKSREDFLRWHRNDSNSGFGAACNTGAQMAVGDYLVFLNNDTEVQEDWIKPCIKHFMRNDEIGIVGSKLLYPDSRIQHAGITFVQRLDFRIQFWPDHRFRGVPSNDPRVNLCEEVPAVTAACLFIPRDLFWKVGGFSEEYGMYFEDVDLNFKVRSLGRKVIYEPRSVVVHHESKSSSSSSSNELMAKAAKIFYWKWKERLGFLADCCSNKPTVKTTVKWEGCLDNPSGYATAMRQHVLNLSAMGTNMEVKPEIHATPSEKGPASVELQLLEALSHRRISSEINVTSFLPYFQEDTYASVRRNNPVASYFIGYSMFETDRIPASWVETCNQMDEIWVPSGFNQKTYADSGVQKEKIYRMPLGIDTRFFNSDLIQPMSFNIDKEFVFLSIFEWSRRKGWDVLLKAYFQGFSSKDEVVLIIHTYSQKQEKILDEIHQTAALLGKKISECPTILVSDTIFPSQVLPSLYKAAHAFVLPTRGEGWGLPFMEAMAMELPVIATRWSSHLDFMDDSNSYLINCETVDIPDAWLGDPPLIRELYAGHRWAEPSWEHTASLMREVYENRAQARKKAVLARNRIKKDFDSQIVSSLMIHHLNRISNSESFLIRKKKFNKQPASQELNFL